CRNCAADIAGARREFLNAPERSPHLSAGRSSPRTKADVRQRQVRKVYSITSSAPTRRPGGTVSPSTFAVFKLTTVSYLVGACTGRLAGFSPRKMRSTYKAACRNSSTWECPLDVRLRGQSGHWPNRS